MPDNQDQGKAAHLLSRPDQLRPDTKPALMVTWAVEQDFGGMTAMCLKRAGLFHDRGVPSAIVTFDANPQLESIRAALRANHRLHSGVPLLNLHEYYAERQETGSPVSTPIRGDASVPWTESTRLHRSLDGTTLLITYTAQGNDKLLRREYLRRDGTAYLVDSTLPAPHDPTKVFRSIHLLASDGTLEYEFTSAARLYRHWLSELVEQTNADVIIDSKFTAGFLFAWEHPRALKFVNFHSTHVAVGQDPLTGKLSSAHSKIIENRDLWDGITFLTESQRTAFVQRFGDGSNAVVISNPVDRPRSLPAFETRKPGKVLHVGRFTKGKNTSAVIDIVDAVARAGTPVHLDLVGDGEQREALENHVLELGIQDLVSFHGHVNDVPHQLESARVLLLCSKFEGQPLAVLEAQAHGCVPVAYDVDFGPRDVIESERNGFLIPYGDAASAATAVLTLLGDDALCSKMSIQGYETAERFGSDQIFNQWQGTLARARANKKTRDALASSKAHLTGLKLHPDGDVDLEIVVDTGSAELTGLRLVASERGTDATKGKHYEPYSATECVYSFRIPGSLRAEVAGSEAVDINVVLDIAGSTRSIRLGPEARLRSTPYFTVYGNLSFK